MKSPVLSLVVCALAVVGCSHAPENKDPFEPVNRKIHAFNTEVDKAVFKPIAKGYVFITPQFVQTGVSNFFDNLSYPTVFINQYLQGKFQKGTEDTGRFIINSTFGLAGLIDVASGLGLKEHEEDFGQTFAKWGFGQGPYVMVPLWGPATVRSGLGTVAGVYTHPLTYANEHPGTRTKLVALSLIDGRARLLDKEDILTGDKYLFMRDAFLQRREYLVQDGEVEEDDPFLNGAE